MGYNISAAAVGVVIKQRNVNDARKALSALFDDGQHHPWCYGPKDIEMGYDTLASAIYDWRFDSELEENGDVRITHFNGEKLGDDELFWATLAPYIHHEEGKDFPYAVYMGEDGEKWRYLFDGIGCIEEKAMFASENDEIKKLKRIIKAQEQVIGTAMERFKCIAQISHQLAVHADNWQKGMENIHALSTNLDKEVTITT